MAKITANPSLDQVGHELPRYSGVFARNVVATVNGNLDFSNFNAKTISVKFTAANTDFGFAHGLGRIPQGFLFLGGTAGHISNGTAPWNATGIHLQSSQAGTATLLVF